jgi:hypothetical protein
MSIHTNDEILVPTLAPVIEFGEAVEIDTIGNFLEGATGWTITVRDGKKTITGTFVSSATSSGIRLENEDGVHEFEWSSIVKVTIH